MIINFIKGNKLRPIIFRHLKLEFVSAILAFNEWEMDENNCTASKYVMR